MNEKKKAEELMAQAIALEKELIDIIEILDQYISIIEMDENDAKALIEEEEVGNSFIFVEGE